MAKKKEGQYICLDAKYLRGKSTGTYLDKGKFVAKGNNIILVDGENSGEVLLFLMTAIWVALLSNYG